MERVGDATLESREITNYAHNNLYKLYYDVYGNLSITKGIAETNHFALRESSLTIGIISLELTL